MRLVIVPHSLEGSAFLAWTGAVPFAVDRLDEIAAKPGHLSQQPGYVIDGIAGAFARGHIDYVGPFGNLFESSHQAFTLPLTTKGW